MSTFNENMNDIFNLPVEVEKKTKAISTIADRKADDDYEYARNNLRDMIDHSKLALDELYNIASVTEAPRAFEVYSTLIKSTVEANKELLDLHHKKKDLQDEENAKTQVTNNSLFVGSTTELMKIINNKND
jgi:hypothetical protein